MVVDKIMKKLEEGDTEGVKTFFKKNLDKINRTNTWGLTYLMAACQLNNTDLIRFLIEAGSDLDMSDSQGNTALHHAVFGQQIDAVGILISKGADINSQDFEGYTALHRAVEKGYEQIVDKILNCRGKYILQINRQTKNDATSLLLASKKGHANIVQNLLQQSNTDVKIADIVGQTPLHWACEGGHTDIVQDLLAARSDVNVKNNEGDTPLHVAVQMQKYNIVSLILSQGSVKLDIQNNKKMTPLLLAVAQGHIGMIEKFISSGSDINAVDKDKNNCLHIAVKRGMFHSEDKSLSILDEYTSKLNLDTTSRLSSTVVACYLANQGANFYYKNNKQQTPLDLIKKLHLRELVKTLFVSKCILCEDREAVITFHPCEHTLVCDKCSKIKLKRCLECKQVIAFQRRFDFPAVEIINDVSQPSARNSQPVNCPKTVRKTKKVSQPSPHTSQQTDRPKTVQEMKKPSPHISQPSPHTSQQTDYTPVTKKVKKELEPSPHTSQETDFPVIQGVKNVSQPSASISQPLHEYKITVPDSLLYYTPVTKKIKKGLEPSPHTSQETETRKLDEKLLHEVAKKLGSKWQQVGRELEMKQSTLEIIKAEYINDTAEQSFQMLYKWFTTSDPNKCTFDRLKKALENCGCTDALQYLS